MKLLVRLVLLALVLSLTGCPSTETEKKDDADHVTKGLLVGITPVVEDNNYQSLWLSFSDGRDVKLRVRYAKKIILQRGKINVIHHDTDGDITSVDILEEEKK